MAIACMLVEIGPPYCISGTWLVDYGRGGHECHPLKKVLHEPRHDVGRSAGRGADNDLNRLRGFPRLRMRGRHCGRDECGAKRRNAKRVFGLLHESSCFTALLRCASDAMARLY